jgi:hypothetical protein
VGVLSHFGKSVWVAYCICSVFVSRRKKGWEEPLASAVKKLPHMPFPARSMFQ